MAGSALTEVIGNRPTTTLRYNSLIQLRREVPMNCAQCCQITQYCYLLMCSSVIFNHCVMPHRYTVNGPQVCCGTVGMVIRQLGISAPVLQHDVPCQW